MHPSFWYLDIVALLLAVSSSAHPNLAVDSTSPPTIYNPDGSPKGDYSSLASLEGLTSNKRDFSGRRHDPAEKYFHESTFDSHYDGRFASTPLPEVDKVKHLRALVRTYLSTMHSFGAETWIMHGSLLGWWWNRRIMPWDSDIDVQVSEAAIEYLATYHNMSVHAFRDVDWLGEVDIEKAKEEEKVREHEMLRKEKRNTVEKGQRKYLLEVNPHYKDPSIEDLHNVIDARWIDTSTGLYIDITAVRLNPSHPIPGYLFCKDRHHYTMRQIFPLRTSVFEGVPVKIPYSYQELLVEEYGEDSLVETVYLKENHEFNRKTMEWVSMDVALQNAMYNERNGKFVQYGSGEKGKDRAGRPNRSGDEKANPQPGMIGDVHHVPGSVEDF